jgi:hypothetical protein
VFAKPAELAASVSASEDPSRRPSRRPAEECGSVVPSCWAVRRGNTFFVFS